MKPDRLCVGIALTTDPSSTRQQLAEFCSALGAATGLDVVPRGVWHYHHLLEGLADGEIHVVWLPPILALRAAAEDRVIPLALPVRHGTSCYQTALFTRADSPIRSVDDLKGARAAWVDRQSAAGYLIIRAHLYAQGVDLEEAFGSELFIGTYDGVAGAVMDGEADVGATYAYFDEGKPDAHEPLRSGWGDADVRIICRSRPIPSDLVAADQRVPVEQQQLVREALIDAEQVELQRAACKLFDAEGFVAPSTEHLERLAELLAGLGDQGKKPRSLVPPVGASDE